MINLLVHSFRRTFLFFANLLFEKQACSHTTVETNDCFKGATAMTRPNMAALSCCNNIQTILLFVIVNQFLAVVLFHHVSLLDCVSSPLVPLPETALNQHPHQTTTKTPTHTAVPTKDHHKGGKNRIPRLYLNFTIWVSTTHESSSSSTEANRLDALLLTEWLEGGRMAHYTKKRFCFNGHKPTTTSRSWLPSCPNYHDCSTGYFDDATGDCKKPQEVIDPDYFWKGLEEMTILQDLAKAPDFSKHGIVVTSWDLLAGAHQIVPKDYLSVKRCGIDHHRACPDPCIQQDDVFWDPRDNLCKPTTTTRTTTRTIPPPPPPPPWVGACSCSTTCYTPQANLPRNTSWPWPNATMRQAYYGQPQRRTDEEINEWNTRQHKYMAKRWKTKPKQYYQESTACNHIRTRTRTTTTTTKIRESEPQPPAFQLSHTAHAAGLHHLYFLPEAKLIFCGIPKVGISEWIKFFRRSYGARDYLSTPYFKEDTSEFQMSNLPLAKAQALWNDPTYTKAVIWRDPAERLLSAYLDKIVRERYTQTYFRIGKHDVPPPVLSFDEFVRLVANTTAKDHHDRRGVHYKIDPHWRPQLFTCGLDHLFPLMDFVGSFDHLPNHTKLLLERVGLWESHGQRFDALRHHSGNTTTTTTTITTTATTDTNTSTKFGGGICITPPPPSPDNGKDLSVEWIDFNQRSTATTSTTTTNNQHSIKHETGSRQKMNLYYTPELLTLVRKAYAMDYAIWDELEERLHQTPNQVPMGREFAHVRDICRIDTKTTT